MRQENMFGLDISQFAAVFNNEKVTLINYLLGLVFLVG